LFVKAIFVYAAFSWENTFSGFNSHCSWSRKFSSTS